jgi:WD40 repeat protein
MVVAFSPDGNTLAVRDRSGTVRLWRAPPLAEIEKAIHLSGNGGTPSNRTAHQ